MAIDSLLKGVRLRHTEAGSGNRTAEVLFVPANYRLTAPKLAEIASKTWKLPPPNLLVQCDAGSAHPSQLCTEAMLALPQMSEWRNDAHHHASASVERQSGTSTLAAMAQAVFGGGEHAGSQRRIHPLQSPGKAASPRGSGRGSCDAPDVSARTSAQEASRARELEVVNDLLFQRLVTVFSAVVDAAIFSNNWIVIDRLSNKSATAELLIEFAVARTSQRPTIIVLDSIERLHNFHSDVTREQLNQIDMMKNSAIPIGSGTDHTTVPLPWLYNPSDYSDPLAFADLPLPRPAEPKHCNADGTISAKRKWQYHYMQTLYGCATHYILFEELEDAIDVSLLGPVGCVCAHGGTLMYQRMRQRIQTGMPLVMLYNTGGVTQAFGSLQRLLARGPLLDSTEMLKRCELVSKEKWALSFGVPEILMMRELKSRAPNLFRKSIVSVDLINDSAEDMLETLTACFSLADGGVPELGLGEAETAVVRNAWRRHLALFNNARRFRGRAVLLQYLLYTLAILTTLASVLYALQNESCTLNLSKSMPSEVFRYITIILPILYIMVATLRSRLRPNEKWATCVAASAAVTAEIYKFRTRSLEYDLAAAKPSESTGKDGNEDLPGKGHQQRARTLFTKKVQEIYAQALTSEVAKGGSLQHRGVQLLDMQKAEDRAKLDRYLHRHVARNLFTRAPGQKRALLALQRRLMSSGKEEADDNVDDFDDFLTTMSVETYIDYRARPLAAHFEQLAPRLSLMMQGLEAVSLLFTAAGAILAVLGMATWVAFTVACATLATEMSAFLNLPARVSATNIAMRDVHNLLTKWEGLSLVDRRTRQMKAECLSVTEGAVLAMVNAETSSAGSAAATVTSNTPKGEEDDEMGSRDHGPKK